MVFINNSNKLQADWLATANPFYDILTNERERVYWRKH